MSLGKSSAPATPDYAGAAQATAAGNLDAAKYATQANRANQYTPYGSLTWAQGKNADGTDNNQWTQSINLNDTGQKLLDQSNRTSMGLAGLQDNATQRVADQQNKPFDFGSVQDVQDQAYKGYTDRLDPQWEQNSKQMDAKLANQGIVQGSEAYNNAMRTFGENKNDAYNQANLSALSTRGDTFNLANSLRNQPLNELNALRTGSQVTNPTFGSYANQATTAGPDMLGATQATFNSDLAGVNANNAGVANTFNGLMNLGGAAMMAPKGTFSDRRLKKNIKRIGKTDSGLNIYSYDYIWGQPGIGVMADEVMHIPGAVIDHPSGYKMVDYSKVK